MATLGIPRSAVEAAWLPRRPLAAHTKSGRSWHVGREVALDNFAYIQPNPPCIKSLIVIDRDKPDTWGIAEALGLPEPLWTAGNAWNGSGHLAYALASPVCVTDAARRRPVNLLARVEAGLTNVLGGDVGYVGLRTKNPLNEAHAVSRGWDGPPPAYSLKELAVALDTLGALPRWDDAKRITGGEVGRNVALFDLTRHWAYTAIRRHGYPPVGEWCEIVEAYAWDRNIAEVGNQFAHGPLALTEVHHLSRSVAKWTHTRFNEAQFVARQTQRQARRMAKSSQLIMDFTE